MDNENGRGRSLPGGNGLRRSPVVFSPLPMRLGEERLELGVVLVHFWLLPPVFDIIDKDAGGGNGGDGSVKNLFG